MTNAAPQYILQSWPTARQWERAQLRSPLTITLGNVVYHGWCTDVCPGGIGFTCAAPLQSGDEITISVSLEGLGSFRAKGIVRHSAAFRSGCEFVFILPAEQQMIERYVRAARRPFRR